MTKYNAEKFWSEYVREHADNGKWCLSTICYAGMPIWYNSFFNYFQRKTLLNLLKYQGVTRKEVLEVGSGTGRWVNLLLEKKALVTGIDISKEMIRIAKKNIKGARLLQMSVTDLKFNDNKFDLVISVTTLQHVPYTQKDKSIKEICRVTKPKGKILVIELVDLKDKAPYLFPLPEDAWISKFMHNGCKLIRTEPEEYAYLIRFFSRIATKFAPGNQKKRCNKQKNGRIVEKILKTCYLLALRVIVYVSYPLEAIFRKVETKRYRLCGFLFEKVCG